MYPPSPSGPNRTHSSGYGVGVAVGDGFWVFVAFGVKVGAVLEIAPAKEGDFENPFGKEGENGFWVGTEEGPFVSSICARQAELQIINNIIITPFCKKERGLYLSAIDILPPNIMCFLLFLVSQKCIIHNLYFKCITKL
jgi:hypothetical protein